MTTLTLLTLVAGFGGAKANCAPCDVAPIAARYPVPDINAGRPCPPLGPPAEVLAVKIVAPTGVRITALPGSPLAKQYGEQVLVGLRPGYAYRFELAGVGREGQGMLYPEVEVRGTLVLRPGMRLMEHFAGIAFSNRDLDRVMNGTLITKVIYLEDPTKALPIRSNPDQPHEIPEETEEAAIRAAFEHGRLVAIVRLGNRKPTHEEFNRVAVANTVLLPGENYLAAPTSPPTLGWHGVPLFDPILGPKWPGEECFTDGGDTFPRLGIRDDGRLGGLTPTDTAAEYTINDKRKVATSNTVCICAPRFIVRRVDIGANGYASASRADARTSQSPPAMLHQLAMPRRIIAREKPLGLMAMIHAQIQRGQQRPGALVSQQGPRAIYQADGVKAVVAAVETREVQNSQEFELLKEVEPAENVKVGDEVTFTLRYRNNTGKPITDLVISDSLSGRLEYIPGSAQSDRPMNVTTSANEAGSVVVQFELPGTLPTNQAGVIKFKAKVR